MSSLASLLTPPSESLPNRSSPSSSALMLASVVRALPVVVGRTDRTGRIVEAESIRLSQPQFAARQLHGRRLQDVAPSAREDIDAALSGETRSFTVVNDHSDQSCVMDFFVSYDEDRGGGALFLGRDITERRLLERQLLRTADAERDRIGADLHDGLGQHLSGLACVAAALARKVRVTQPEVSEMGDLVAKLATESIEQAKALARGLCPVTIEHRGLVAALEELAEQSTKLHRLDCKLSVRGCMPDLDSSRALQIYRIVQEAIHNAARHGTAQRVQLGLLSRADRVKVVVLDDGAGFNPALAFHGHGRGLRLMQYRATLVGGHLDLFSKPGWGTRLTCTLPHAYQSYVS